MAKSKETPQLEVNKHGATTRGMQGHPLSASILYVFYA